MMNHRPRSKRLWILFTVIMATATMLHQGAALAVGSSGFQLSSLSPRTAARANAVTADPEDPSTNTFNPAGLTELEGTQVYAGTNLVVATFAYEGAEGRADEDSSETMLPVPLAYLSMETPIENLYFGFGANSPFGLSTKYSSTGNFKYIGHFNELTTLSYTSSLAYAVNDAWSVGAGWTYLESTAKQVGKYNVATLVGVGGLPDGDFELDVEGTGNGWTIGVLHKHDEKSTLGLSYRSPIRVQYKGYLSSDNLGLLAGTFGGSSHRTSADTDVTLPHNLTAGYNYQWSEKLDLEFDFGWTGWSSYDSVDYAFGTASSNAVLNGFNKVNRDFIDSFSYQFGGSYDLSEAFTVSAGYFFYTQAANINNYDNVIPDGNRHGFSVGLESACGPYTVDLSYLGMLIDETDIENTVGVANGADIDGKYKAFAHIAAIGVRKKF